MGEEEKRKRERTVSEADKALKSPCLAVGGKSLGLQAAAASPSDSSESSEETTSSSSGSDSAGGSRRCHHMCLDSESVDIAVFEIKFSGEIPKCRYPGCGITWRGAGEDKEGMMQCIDCHYISCAQGVVKEDPRGHALLHATDSKHHIAQWYDEPNLGYCFECRHVMRLSDNKDHFREDECAEVDGKVNDERGMVASKTKDQLGMVASNTKDDCGIGVSNAKVDWAMAAGDGAGGHVSGYAFGDGYVIRGMPNPSRTSCYMNASLQCLLALGKLRAMILRPEARLGDIGRDLKQLFVETGSLDNATRILDPKMILVYLRSLHQEQERFEAGKMEDSHEFLTSLRNALDKEVVEQNEAHIMQTGDVFPTFGHSIFGGQLSQTVYCKRCSPNQVTYHSFDGLQLAVSSKDPPARSKPLQVDSSEALDYIPTLCDDDTEEIEESSADSHNPEDKEKPRGSDIVYDEAEHTNYLESIEDCLTLFFCDLTNCENCSKLAELPETSGSKNVEPIMARTSVNTAVDGDQTELSDRKTCPNERPSDFNSLLVESPSRQPFRSDSHHEVILSDDMTTREKGLASCSTANEKAESSEGVQKAAPSCLPTDQQTDPPSAQDTNTEKKGSGKHVLDDDDHSAQQVEETQSEQADGNGSAIRNLIMKLPPVLTIQVKRYAPDLSKLEGHVSFKEILQLGPFMDPSSEDKDNTSYRLVGVVVHSGNTLNGGHYIAYVRGSGSSWVCANDRDITVASLEEVLKCEAYILFYERIEGGGMPGNLPTN